MRERRLRGQRRTDETSDRDPAELLADLGLVDVDYYRGQLASGAEALLTVSDVARYHRERGRGDGLALSPLIEPEWWRDDVLDEPAIKAAEQELADGSLVAKTTSPLLADPVVPFMGASRDLVLGALAGSVKAQSPSEQLIPAVTARFRRAVTQAISSMPNIGTRSGVNWVAAQEAAVGRFPRRTSVLVPTYEDWRMTVNAVRSVLLHSEDADLEVLIIDNGSRLSVTRLLIAVFLDDKRVRVIRCDRNTNFAGGMNRGFADSTGETLVLLNNDAEVTQGWLDPLLRELRASPDVRGVQPLLLYPDTHRVQAAGTVFLGEGVLPWHFLAGHPSEDARRVSDRRFSAVTAAVMAVRARDVVTVRGFDEDYANGYEDVDLCLRLIEQGGGYFTVATQSEVFHPEGSSPGRSAHDSANRIRFLQRWRGRMPGSDRAHYEDIGQALVGMRPLWYSEDVGIMITDPHVVRRQRSVTTGRASGHACLRWALVTAGSDADAVEHVRRALHELGQEVVSFAGGVHASDALDDVVVAFDASADLVPRGSAFNVLIGPGGDDAPWDARISSPAHGEDTMGKMFEVLVAAERILEMRYERL